MTWGRQLDVRPISATDFNTEAASALSDVTVARYVAKYATKAAEAASLSFVVLDVESEDGTASTRELAYGDCRGNGTRVNLDRFDLSPHARRLIQT